MGSKRQNSNEKGKLERTIIYMPFNYFIVGFSLKILVNKFFFFKIFNFLNKMNDF